SVIDGNRLLHTNGISLTHQYRLFPGKPAFLMLQSSNEVRNNLIDQAPLFGGLRGQSGIRNYYVITGASQTEAQPPVLGFGTVIVGNRLLGADDVNGAIEFENGGGVGFLNAHDGCTATWPLAVAPLVFHNELQSSRGIDIAGRDIGPR